MNAVEAANLANEYVVPSFEEVLTKIFQQINVSAEYGGFETSVCLNHSGAESYQETLISQLQGLGYKTNVSSLANNSYINISWKKDEQPSN